MSKYDILIYAIPVGFVCFLIWQVIDSRSAREATIGRSRAIMDESERSLAEGLEISRKHLEVAEKTLEEIKALRKLLEEKA